MLGILFDYLKKCIANSRVFSKTQAPVELNLEQEIILTEIIGNIRLVTQIKTVIWKYLFPMEHVPLEGTESTENTHNPMEHVPLEEEEKSGAHRKADKSYTPDGLKPSLG